MGCVGSKQKSQSQIFAEEKKKKEWLARAKQQHAAEEAALKKNLDAGEGVDALAHEIAVDYVADHLKVEEKFHKENFRVNGEMRNEILVYDLFLTKF